MSFALAKVEEENVELSKVQLTAGDKVKFVIKGVGIFVGYIKYLTGKAISLKGCRLVRMHDSAYKLHNVDPKYYEEQHTHTFLVREFVHVEILERAPF
jgi:hypothetical protein